MKYVPTFEQFIQSLKYKSLNEALDKKQWNEKQKEIIKEIKDFGRQIASLIKKASSDEEWEKLLSVVQYFDEDMDADLIWHEDFEDDDDEDGEDVDAENAEVFKENLTYGIKQAISDVKGIDLDDWNELTQEDWMEEEGYGAYLKARKAARKHKLIK